MIGHLRGNKEREKDRERERGEEGGEEDRRRSERERETAREPPNPKVARPVVAAGVVDPAAPLEGATAAVFKQGLKPQGIKE